MAAAPAGGEVKVRDVLYQLRNARAAYERFREMGSHPEQARNAVALLVWLEQAGVRALSHFPSLSAAAVGLVAAEADAILRCLRADDAGAAELFPDIPLLSALCPDGADVDPRFFVFNQDLVVRGVADILDGVGALVFNDRLWLLLRRYQTGLVGLLPELEAPYAWQPATVPEDYRSMFITFSRGMPVEREEIFDYFRQKWGDCIVRVLMEKTTGGQPPMYGRIIFKKEAFVSLVLNGEDLVKISIRDRQFWVRKYIPRPQNA
ncbi:hypothetical protein ACP4OV_021754 [Aristida adscensionis]